MLHSVVLCILILCSWVASKHKEGTKDELGGGLITSLRTDANLDLSADEEYEDLRAELLAYHTALASITSESESRRSLKTTPCWGIGGICVNYKLCTGHRYLTEVPGCKNGLQVCCLTWNRFKVRDMRDKGLKTLAMPWSNVQEFGGEGVVDKLPQKLKKERMSKSKNTMQGNATQKLRKNNDNAIVLIFRSNDN